MYPVISIGGVKIPTFTLAAIVGVCSFVFIALCRVFRLANSAKEAYYILPKLFISLGVGFAGAVFFDALFKIRENGGFKISGMTFYGGIITGVAVLTALLKAFRKNTRLGVVEWLNLLTVPFLVFHFFGRIGCFLGGCCYGKQTDGIFGMAFPDNGAAGIFHYGKKVYPTQLYEAAAIAVIAVSLLGVKHPFRAYCFSYPTARFLLEFLRGDDRGGYFFVFSPAQAVSLLILVSAIAVTAIKSIFGSSPENGAKPQKNGSSQRR